MHRRAVLAALAVTLALPLAAATTRTWPAGKPPWCRGDVPAAPKLGWLPVQVVPGPPGTPDEWVPTESLGRLAAALTQSMAAQPVPQPWVALEPLPAKGMPSVYLGCTLEPGLIGECDADLRTMELGVTGPSKAWRSAAVQLMQAQGLDGIVVPAVTVANHWLHQKNVKGTKEILLGDGHAQRVPWLTSLDTPVEVVQLTLMLIDRDGKVARSCAEGLLAVRTPFGASAAGLQKVTSPEDIDAVTSGARREDLPGAPRVTDAAVRALLQQLLGPARSAPREP